MPSSMRGNYKDYISGWLVQSHICNEKCINNEECFIVDLPVSEVFYVLPDEFSAVGSIVHVIFQFVDVLIVSF